MKETYNFTKLTLLNRLKKIVLIFDQKTKVTFIRDIGRKEQLMLHYCDWLKFIGNINIGEFYI